MKTEIQAGPPTFSKQMTVRISGDDWKRLRLAAARKRIPLTEMLLEMLEPGLAELRAKPPTRDDDE